MEAERAACHVCPPDASRPDRDSSGQPSVATARATAYTKHTAACCTRHRHTAPGAIPKRGAGERGIISETTMRQRVESVFRAQSGPPQQFSPKVLARVRALKGMQNAVMRGALEGMGVMCCVM